MLRHNVSWQQTSLFACRIGEYPRSSGEVNRARTSSLFNADDPSRLSLSPVLAGKADRQRDHSVLSVVRAAMGDRQLPHADRCLDHHCFLLPSVDDQRDVLLQNRADHFGEGRARCRDLFRSQRPRRERRTDLPAGQFATGGYRRAFASPYRRDRRRDVGCAVGCPGG